MKIKNEALDVIKKAVDLRASDVFFMPKKMGVEIDFRINRGVMNYKMLSIDNGSEIINWFKFSAQMDIAEHRRPQNGSMIFEDDEKKYYLRFSSVGDYLGKESLVIRIIYSLSESRYFFPEQFEILERLSKKRGLIITSGPTGSGKTTTMYELAKRLCNNQVVMTIEDPVEIHESRFLQSQVNLPAGISYMELLKAALRHRPDILIIGEIRDSETARLAVDAALSGHLVLATVHAKSTYQTVSRLISLGVGKVELSNCLTAVSYQRLLAGTDGQKCLLDIGERDKLFNNENQNVDKNFFDWQDNLKVLVKKGEISEEVRSIYQEG